jgi:hypothetical protein
MLQFGRISSCKFKKKKDHSAGHNMRRGYGVTAPFFLDLGTGRRFVVNLTSLPTHRRCKSQHYALIKRLGSHQTQPEHLKRPKKKILPKTGIVKVKPANNYRENMNNFRHIINYLLRVYTQPMSIPGTSSLI